MIWRTKSIKFVLLNSYCFARGHGLGNMPELKACALIRRSTIFRFSGLE